MKHVQHTQITLALNITGQVQVDLYFHNRNQLLVPNRNEAFGSTREFFFNFDGDTPHRQFASFLELVETEERSLDKPGERCNDAVPADDSDLTRCITGHIEKQIGCRYPKYLHKLFIQIKFVVFRSNILSTDSTLPTCNTTAQLQTLFNMTSELRDMNENAIYKQTGCLSTCQKVRMHNFCFLCGIQHVHIRTQSDYHVNILKPMNEELNYSGVNNTLGLRIWYATGSHFVRKEYLLYDLDSLVADVGGYMGLLLGHSLLSLFYKLSQWSAESSRRCRGIKTV